MTPEALHAAIRSGEAPPLLDVREPAEFAAGHVPGAVNLPFWRLLSGLPEVPFERPAVAVVYCGHGPRATMARAALRLRGFRRVVLLDGHMTGWRSRQLPEER